MFDQEPEILRQGRTVRNYKLHDQRGKMAEVDGVRTPHRKRRPLQLVQKKILWEDLGECAPSLPRG